MTKAEKKIIALKKCKLIQIKLFAAVETVTSEDVCRNLRNVKLNNFLFQHAVFCHVCHCSLCVISY